MKMIKITVVFMLIMIALCGCASPQNRPPENSTSGKLPETASKISSAPSASETLSPESTADLKMMDFNGDAITNLPNVLDRIVKSNKPITCFAAKILDVKAPTTSEQSDYTFTIDKVEVNDKSIDSALSTEPPYFNKEVKKEEIKVPYDVILVVENNMLMPVGDEFIQYIHENVDEKGDPIFIYNFYLCGDEVAFINDIYIP